MAESEFPVLVEKRDDRVIAVLNRPHARNAINLAIVEALHQVCALMEVEPKPLIITGAAGTFAAGADISELRDRNRHDAMRGINRSVFDRIANLPMPTIAAIDGHAFGGGAELAYACDLRIATSTARFANPEPGLGILAAAGATWRLRELVGVSVAKQVLIGGYVLDATSALRHGLISEIVDSDQLLPRAHELVERMLNQAPLALRLTKALIDAREPHPLTDDLAQAVLFETDEKRARLSRFVEARQNRSRPDDAPRGAPDQ